MSAGAMVISGQLWLSAVIGLIGIIAIVALALRFRVIRQSVLSLLGIVPALLLVILAIPATALWKPALTWVDRLPWLRTLPDRFAQLVLQSGETKGAAEKPAAMFKRRQRELMEGLWPPADYPFLYTNLPEDIRRPLFEDGRLIGGVPITWLADRHVTVALLGKAARAGIAAALLMAGVLALLFILALISALISPILSLWGAEAQLLERWPHGEVLTAAPLSQLGSALWLSVQSLIFGLLSFLLYGLATGLFSAGVGILTAFAVIELHRRQTAKPYQKITKDSLVRWPYRAEARAIAHATYKQQTELSTGYLKNTPLFELGKATGTLRLRGDFTAPMPDSPLCLDGDSIFQHTLVLGGTGEGKTAAILKPLMRQLIAPPKGKQPRFGLYVCDAKGVLWNDALTIVQQAGRDDDVVVIGTGEGQSGVNITAGLTPTQIASVLRSVMTQMGGNASDSFWPDMASTALRHALTIGQAFAETKAGKAVLSGADGEDQLNPYSLWWAYQALQQPDMLKAAIKAIEDAIAEEAERVMNREAGAKDEPGITTLLTSDEVTASRAYLSGAWAEMPDRTQSGILASASQLLDGFSGAPALRRRFVCGLSDGAVPLTHALDGKIVLSALSNIEDGMPARLVNILLKTCLYRAARIREATLKTDPDTKPQDKPCAVIMDEVQEIVTVDPASGLSDATFWNVARSTGLVGIFATQTVAALDQAMGDAAARNFLQQARSKIFLRSEDRATIDYACWCAGSFERNRVFDDGQAESIEHRALIEGWNPFAEIEEDMAEPQNGALLLLRAAGMMVIPAFRNPKRHGFEPLYAPDLRFVPAGEPLAMFGLGQQNAETVRLSALQAAHWRAEDLERRYRAEGNTLQPALTPADMIGMGRWHAYALIQRAGAMRQDIIRLKHDHS